VKQRKDLCIFLILQMRGFFRFAALGVRMTGCKNFSAIYGGVKPPLRISRPPPNARSALFGG